MTRILFVNHASRIGGAEFVLLDIVTAWPGATVFLFEDGPLVPAIASRAATVRVSRWGRGLSSVRREGPLLRAFPLLGRLGAVAAEIARAARAHDIVYANSQKAFVLAALACALARRPLVWHLHDIIDASHFGAAQRRLQVALANRMAALVIVPSAAAAKAFIASGGRADLVRVVANGIAAGEGGSERETLRAELGLPPGPLVGVFSRLSPWKGQHVLLEALTRLPRVGCVIVGDALFGETAYVDELKTFVRDHGLAGRVRFLGHRDDVRRVMRAVDIVIHPSVDPEPFGRTLVEAMLARVPVIATDAGAASDILDHGVAGTLVPPNDSAALAAAIAAAFDDPAATAIKIARAARRAQECYGVARMLKAIAALVATLSPEARA